jgi:hypothetical protein
MLDLAKSQPGSDGKDTIHIRIWKTATGELIYDNMPGVADNVIPITPLQGGTIKLTP